MILLFYNYKEDKKKVYNIEGQLRGLQGSGHSKTYAPQNNLVSTQVQAQRSCKGAFTHKRCKTTHKVPRLERF
jgi:hypothetical protein